MTTDELMALTANCEDAAHELRHAEHSGASADVIAALRSELRADREKLRTALEAVVEDARRKECERIADLWAGCTTEAEGHGLVDIGASIRAGRLVDEP